MSDSITMSKEQFHELLDEVRGSRRPQQDGAGVGLGALPRVPGLGCGDGEMGPLATGVYSMLAAGSPRLALAKAMGIPLAPYAINVRAVFPDTSTSGVPDVGSDVKITQDTLIDSIVYRITNQSTTANQNQFQAQSDYYYNWQSGIEATLDVTGAPRYAVTGKFTPLATLADAFNGDSRWGGGWILTYQEQLKMSFNAKVTIPTAPIEVCVTFRAWIPVWDELVQMTNREAFVRLRELGFDISDAYAARCCR
jgi:hypothetical protein